MNTETNEKPVEILLAEDNPGDVRLTREAFKRGRSAPILRSPSMAKKSSPVCDKRENSLMP